MRRVLPIVIVLLGLAGGVGAGMMFKPEPEARDPKDETASRDGMPEGNPTHPAIEIRDPGMPHEGAEEEPVEIRSYVNIGSQTIVPIVDGDRTTALMLFELAVDVEPSAHDAAVALEPRLRDAFLRELLRMASTGAFTETYTADWVIDELRHNLATAAHRFLGEGFKEILILDIVRQEM